MILFPAIDLYEGKTVRLYKGDYAQMTVYSEHPEEIARDFAAKGATHAHLVDLEGAKNGTTPNLDTVLRIKEAANLFCEIGGGIRSMDTVRTYLDAGLDRVILGTAAVEDPSFLHEALEVYGDQIAVGVDVRDGYIAVRGWTEKSALGFMDFCRDMEKLGVRTLICTDISRDGAMRGTNREMYRELSRSLGLQITASGGVSTLEDIRSLKEMGLYGAIIGKAYYTGDIDLKKAIDEVTP
jgi:phosphoribosylformimino-5-aminoimidazole carboxamide ribotide isomerase